MRRAPSHTLSPASYSRAMDAVCAQPLSRKERLRLAELQQRAQLLGLSGKERAEYMLLRSAQEAA